jgi:hypothetical protein
MPGPRLAAHICVPKKLSRQIERILARAVSRI